MKDFRTLVTEAYGEFKTKMAEWGEISYQEEMEHILNSTNAEYLQSLSMDEDDTVRLMVAKNINTPVETLRNLENDLDDQVSAAASDTLESVLYGIKDEEENE